MSVDKDLNHTDERERGQPEFESGPGMAGAPGAAPTPDRFANPTHDTSVGLPQAVGTTGADRAASLGDHTGRGPSEQMLGTGGGVSSPTSGDVEPGAHGQPGTPTPGSTPAQASADEAATTYDPAAAEPPILSLPGDAPHSPNP